MALTLTDAVRNAMVNALTALIDASASPGKIVIGTAAMADTLVNVVFSADSFEDGIAGVATSKAIANASVIMAGTAGAAKITNGDGTSIITGLTVGVSASNINLTNLVLAVNDQIAVGLGDVTITQPAS